MRAALVLLAVVLAGAGDGWQQDREVAQLLRATTAAEAVVRASQQQREVLTEQQSVLFNVSDSPAPPSDASLQAVARDAALWLPRLGAPARAVAAVRVLPWHRDVRRAQQAQRTRLRIWEQELRSTRTQPRRVLRDAAEVRAARAAAVRALLEVAAPERVAAAYRP